MASVLGQWGEIAGVGVAYETLEAYFGFGRRENLIVTGLVIDKGATDAGVTPTTTLRPGLLLGQISATGKYSTYAAANTDGTQVATAILGAPMRGTNILSGTTVDHYYGCVVGGPVQTSRLFGLDNKGRADMANRFIFDDDMAGILGRRYPILIESAKTANYTIVAADSGKLFTNTGAVGAVTFTLPAVAIGLSFEFLITANQTVQVSSTTAVMVYGNNATVTSIAFSTGSQKIGAHLRIYASAAGTAWYVENLSGTASGATSVFTATLA